MLVGLVIKLSPGTIIQHMVQFNGGFFFNLLLPPIILNSGYELKRASDLCQLLIVENVGLYNICLSTAKLLSKFWNYLGICTDWNVDIGCNYRVGGKQVLRKDL